MLLHEWFRHSKNKFILCSTDGGRLTRAWGASERDGIEGRVGLDRVVIEMDIRQSWLDGRGLASLADAELADGVIDFLSNRRRPDATEGDGRLREVVWGGVAR